MILVLDVENTVQITEDGKKDGSPFNPSNRLVSVGFASIDAAARSVGPVSYEFLYHRDFGGDPLAARERVQQALRECTLLVGHYVKHDLAWLLESGFEYDGPVYDTAIGEYVLARGRKWGFSLEDSAERRNVALKKRDLIDAYWKKGIGFEAMPIGVVEEYGRGDVQSAGELFLTQQDLYAQELNAGLVKTRDLMNEFCLVLTDMERNGIAIDLEALDQIEQQYLKEQQELRDKLQQIVYEVMGDTPINLGSPEQLSQVVYSRRVKNKEAWVKTFNIGKNARGKPLRRPKFSAQGFADAVRANTEKIYKTKAIQCSDCQGRGKVFKTKKDGTAFAKPHGCKSCDGTGLLYQPLPHYAGLRLSPRTVQDVSALGFATDKDTLKELIAVARSKGNARAVEFLGAIVRLNAVDTYLSSFVGGIKRGVRPDRILHPRFNQTVTATGRLSSSDPNFQNQPRGGTFPVRRAVVSRWGGEGSILEGDYAQLEFRAAGQLSGCDRIIADVKAGVDVHSVTAKTMTDAGQPTTRQEAKPDTFKPLYGGVMGTPAQMAYYKAFLEKYAGVAKWHVVLQEAAISKKVITLPTGREFAFPEAQRMPWGGSSFATQIKNYPVQAFATADMVPLANILLWRRMREAKVKSLLVNTVHDSLVADVYPGEEQLMANMMRCAMLDVVPEMTRRYGIEFIVPIDVELKIGKNWLDSKTVHVQEPIAA